jgi:hypothetical protein
MGNRQTQEQQQGIRQFPGAPLPDDDLIEADEPRSGEEQDEEWGAAAEPAEIEAADTDDDDDAEEDADDEADVDDEEEDGSGGHV